MSDEQGPGGLRDRKRPGPTIDLRAENTNPGARAAWATRLRATLAGLAQRWHRDVVQRVQMTMPERFPWRLIGAGIAAGVLAVVLVLLAASIGRDGGRNALEARLAHLEQLAREAPARAPVAPSLDPKIIDDLAGRVAKLEAAGAAPRLDPKTLDDLAARITKLEAAGATPVIDPRTIDNLAGRVARLEAAGAPPRAPATDAATANRIVALENAVKSIDERLGAAARRSDELGNAAREISERSNALASALADLSQKVGQIPAPTVERSDLDALTTQIAALDRSTRSVEAELAKRAATDRGDRVARLATLSVALEAAASRGEPLKASLAAIRALGVETQKLAPLEPYSETGVPAASALGRELLSLLPALAKSIGTAPRDGGIFDRLAANAEKLVRVRPVDEPAGDDPAAVLARIEARANQSDIAGALAALGQLPASARPIAADWIAKAQARTAALAASRQLALDALAALGTNP